MKARHARTSRRSATMKKTGFTFALLAILLASCDRVCAQKPAPKPVPVTPAPDLSKLNIEQILQQLPNTKVPASAEETSPLQLVAEFLQLGMLLASGGNPAQVGVLVIQIHALQQRMAQAQQAFLAQFMTILDADQLQRLQAVQI